jgi:hypothetical protein
MTAASFDPGPHLFSALSNQASRKVRGETFALSFLGQAAILAIIVYFIAGNADRSADRHRAERNAEASG